MDEIVQQIQVQYSTLPSVLAQVNSTIAALMLIGIIGKQFSQNSLRNDFQMILLKNVFQEKYLDILNINKLLNLKNFEQRNQDYQKNLSLQQIDENLERQEKDDNYSISIPTNNYKFKQDFSIKSQSECLNTLKQYELSQDEIKQTDNSLQIKQSKYFESEQNLKNIQAEKMLKKERFNIQKEENRQNQNDTICNNLELLEQTSRNVNEKNKIQNMTLLDMLSNSNYIKKSNYIGDQSPNKFKNHNSEQKNETNNHYSLKFVALKDKKLANQIQKIIFKTKQDLNFISIVKQLIILKKTLQETRISKILRLKQINDQDY
ncbi:hypothetical protein ABPG74_004736 [Tetrahymena malaccensis]